MSKLIKKIIEDIEALEVDDAIKTAFKDSVDAMNEEFKEELKDTKTRLNEGFKEEKDSFADAEAGYLKDIAKLKDVEVLNPDKELVDRLAVLEKENTANKELAANNEKERIKSIIDIELMEIYKDSIDPKMMVELSRNRVKLVDGKVYSNDSDMLNASQLKENSKTEKPHMWKAAGIGGSGAGGKGKRSTGEYYSQEEINTMSEKDIVANLDKVNKSAQFHAKNK